MAGITPRAKTKEEVPSMARTPTIRDGRRKVAADLARPEERFRRELMGTEERDVLRCRILKLKAGRAACPHCTAGKVYEPTEDTLVDEVHECPMCFGTAKRTTRAEREAIRAGRS